MWPPGGERSIAAVRHPDDAVRHQDDRGAKLSGSTVEPRTDSGRTCPEPAHGARRLRQASLPRAISAHIMLAFLNILAAATLGVLIGFD
jgi:hypothetical protein